MDGKYSDILRDYGITEELGKKCTVLKFQRSEEIVSLGEELTCLYIIIDGKAKVLAATPDGKNLILSYVLSEGIVGDIEFMTGETEATASVIAVTETVCIKVPFQGTDLKGNVTFLNRIGEGLAKALRESSRRQVAGALLSGEERLAAYILDTTSGEIFQDKMTDVSHSVGLSYRHMYRILEKFCREGILKKEEKGYRILSRDRLEERGRDV